MVRIKLSLGCAICAVACGSLSCSSAVPSNASAGPVGPEAVDAAAEAALGPSYSSVPGTDLPVPAVADGVQVVTPDYDPTNINAAKMIVGPGAEIFLCYYVNLPNDAEFDVGEFQSWMSPASSHHFIVYQQAQGNAANGTGLPVIPQPDGTIQNCATATGNWVYATSTPGAIVRSTMPANVGLPFPAGQQIVLNMHFINPGNTTLYPKVKLNILRAKNVLYKAAALVSFNRSIDVPAATSAGPGTQTVNGTCTVPAGSKIFSMSTHTHKHATAAVVNYVSGGATAQIVHTGATTTYPSEQRPGTGTDWEHPGVSLWQGPDFLTAKTGDSFTYSCSYVNTSSTPVTVGETAATNEMCMMVGYFFPAGAISCQDTVSTN
jgi:hypothetical protein